MEDAYYEQQVNHYISNKNLYIESDILKAIHDLDNSGVVLVKPAMIRIEE